VQGSIGYFGLTNWWLKTLSESERVRIVSIYGSREAKTLAEGTFTGIRKLGMGYVRHSSGLGFYLGNCVDFLIAMVRKLNREDNYILCTKVVQQIIEQVDSPTADVVDKHIAYNWMAMHFYDERKIGKFAIQRAIWACLKQIEISPQMKPLMRIPARLTTEELRRLSREAGGEVDGKSLWEYCRDQNIFRTNSIVRDKDIASFDAGYRNWACLETADRKMGPFG
jgi:hypothetical protein